MIIDGKWRNFRIDGDAVFCKFTPFQKAVNEFKRKVNSSKNYKTLKRRRKFPSVQARRRHKRFKANYRRLKQMRAL